MESEEIKRRIERLRAEIELNDRLYYVEAKPAIGDADYDAMYNELLALGGDANNIPYFYDGEQLIEGNDAVMAHLQTLAS